VVSAGNHSKVAWGNGKLPIFAGETISSGSRAWAISSRDSQSKDEEIYPIPTVVVNTNEPMFIFYPV
jgi:hypothetical protein